MGCLRIKYDDGIPAFKNWKVFVGGLEKSEAYRYDYQGQFAEKDGETGLHHFELRQWDARIGRWNSTDPYGQYFSPYMGMGNNPLSLVDPNGGFTNPPPGGSIFMDEITLTASGGGTPFSGLSSITLSSLSYDFEVPDIVYDYQQHQVQNQSDWVRRVLDVSNNAEAARNAAALTFSGYAKMPKGLKRGYAYKLSKVTNLKAGKIHQGLKSFAAGGAKLTRRLGPVGLVVETGMIAYELKTDTWDAHTVVNGGLIVVGGAAAVFGAPLLAVGVVVYGVGDYFFDFSENIDSSIGRNSGVWEP